MFSAVALTAALSVIFALPALGADQPLQSQVIEPTDKPGAIESWTQAQTRAFADSDIVFSRTSRNLPFLPFAYFGATHYGDAQVRDTNLSGDDLDYQQNSASIFGFLPVLVSDRDAIAVGGYANRSEFRVNSQDASLADEFSVSSAAFGAGWLHQNSPDWQTAAFIAPFYNRTNLDNGSDYWQVMGGVFTRYTQSDELWWAFGAFANSTPFEEYVLPYVGFSWSLNPEWTVSAIMPWPQVTYAPDNDRFFSFGANIAGNAWAIDQASGEASLDLNAFDVGVSYNQRLSGWLWGSLSAGVGGLRGLQVETEGGLRSVEFDVTRSPYVRLNLTMRPSGLF